MILQETTWTPIIITPNWTRCLSFLLGLLTLFGLVPPLAAMNVGVNVLSASTRMPLTNTTITVQTGKKVLSTNGPAASPIRIKLPAAVAPIEVTAFAPGYSPIRTFIGSVATSGTNVTLRLPEAQIIGGRVLEEGTSRPIVGAHVFINFPRKLLGPKIPLDDLPIVTGADGRWRCDWLPADVSMVRIQVRRSGYELASESTPSLADLRSETATVTLRPLVLLQGVVLDPSGHPVPGASVVYGPQYMLWGLEENKKTHTDARGRFQFTGIQAGQLAVGAYSQAFAPVAKVVNVQPKLPPITLKLGLPHMVSARVVDEQGDPVSDVHVRWDEAGIFRYPGWSGITGTNGQFAITNAPDRQISVDLNRVGFMDMAFIHLQPDRTNQTIVLPPVMEFEGKVLVGDSEQRVAKFKAMPGIFQSFPGQENVFSGSQYQAKDFSDGVLDLKIKSPPIAGLPWPLKMGVRITANGFRTETLGPFTNSVDHLIIRLQPAVLRKLQFLGPGGKPAAGTEVRIAREPFYLRTQNGRFSPFYPLAEEGLKRFTADTNGVVTMADDPDARAALAIADSGFLVFAPTNPSPATVLHLIPWATIEGTLRLRGKPLANQEMALLVPYTPETLRSNLVWLPNPLGNQQITTDAQGHFRFDRVPPGDIGVAWAKPSKPVSGMFYPAGRPQYSGLLDTIQLNAGQHAKLELNESGIDVAGRIILPPGAPANYDWRYASISLSRPLPELSVPTNLNGHARSQWLRNWFYSDKGKPYRAWIRVATGIEGRNGKLSPADRSVPIAAGGTFVFRGLPPGQFNLSISLDQPPDAQNQQAMPWENTSLKFVVPQDAGAHLNLGDVGWTNSYSDVPAPKPSEREPVTVGIFVGRNSLIPHAIVPLRVRIRVSPSYHIYARGENSKTYTPLSLKLDLPEGWKAWGDWTGPVGQLQDGHLILSGDLMFRRQLIVPAKLADSVRLVCEVRAQACNDQLCWPPKTQTAGITVTATSKTSKSSKQ